MNQFIDEILFRDLLSCDPDDVIKRTGALYDEKKRCYRVTIWGNIYDVMPEQSCIKPVDQWHDTYQDYLYLFMLHYLMKAQDIPLSGQWVSEKDISGGAAFFRGPHLLPTHIPAQAFGNDLSGFSDAAKRLGGRPVPMADAAFSFEITPKIPVAVLLWLGDEEFESQAKLLFDKSIDQQLPLDIIYALAVEICHAFKLPK